MKLYGVFYKKGDDYSVAVTGKYATPAVYASLSSAKRVATQIANKNERTYYVIELTLGKIPYISEYIADDEELKLFKKYMLESNFGGSFEG